MIEFVNSSYHRLNGTIVSKLLESKFVYDVNVIFLPTKLIDLLGIKIVLRLKKYTESVLSS